jgi:Fe-S oxidoreductase
MNKLDSKLKNDILALSGEIISCCIQCGMCTGNCLLANVDASFNPRNLARMTLLGMRDYLREHPEVPYSCNICGLCKEVCPRGLDIGKICVAIREKLVEEGKGPLAGHKVMNEDLDFAKSSAFALNLPDPDTGRCRQVWFPGCSLSGYSPPIVIKTWDYLRKKLPGTGIILGCCGALAHSLGRRSVFSELIRELEAKVHNLGASELITGCPECYYTIKNAVPNFHVTGLYEVMVEFGIPEEARCTGETFSLHDACKTRWERSWHESVRTLLNQMGCQIEELRHSRELTYCCGQGGLSVGLNPFRVLNIASERLNEAHFDLVSYCAGCRETFAFNKPSLHILDLVFNPNWKKDKTKKPNLVDPRRKNRAELKSQLETMQEL